MKRVNYHLTEEEIDRLQSLSGKTGLTVAEIIRRAVDEYLDKRKVPTTLQENLEKKGGMKEMMKPKEAKQPRVTKQLGVQVDIKQWRRFRALAFEKGRTSG